MGAPRRWGGVGGGGCVCVGVYHCLPRYKGVSKVLSPLLITEDQDQHLF